MSRITTLSMAFEADLSTARRSYDEFVRYVEGRRINLPVNGFGSPNAPATSTSGATTIAGAGGSGAYTFSGSYAGQPATTIAGQNLGGGAQQQAAAMANAVAGPMGAATPQILVDRMVQRREREANLMNDIQAELQGRAGRGEIGPVEMMALGSRQSLARAVREGMREPRGARTSRLTTISAEAAMADARAYADVQEMRREARDGLAESEDEGGDDLTSAAESAAARGPRMTRMARGGGGRQLRFRSGLGRMLTAMYAVRELSVLADAAAMQNNPLLNQTNLQSIQTANAAVDRAGGVLLGIPTGVMNLTDTLMLAGGADPSQAGSAGFGPFGHYSPLARQTAVYNATQATNLGRAQTQGMITIDQATTAARLSDFGTQNIVTQRNPFAKRRAEAEEQFRTTEATQDSQRTDLQLRLTQAQAEGDKGQSNIIQAELNAFERQYPITIGAARRRRRAELDATGFEEGASQDQMRFANQSTQLRMKGFDSQADLAALNAKFAPVFDENGVVIAFGAITRSDPRWKETASAYRMAGTAIGRHEESVSILASAGIESLQRLINRDPLGSQLATIAGEREAALKEIGDQDSPKAQRIRKESSMREDYARQQDEDRDMLIGMSIAAQGSQISTLLGQAPGTQGLSFGTRSEMSQIIGIRAAGQRQAKQFFNEGKGGFGIETLMNTIGMLDVERENIMDSIRGEQFDVRNRDLTNTRDTEDLGAILKEIVQQQKQLAVDIAAEMMRLVA